jgi:hypothetical protein
VKWSDLWTTQDPPTYEAVRAICWDVRWSDSTGTQFLAKLSDVLNPDQARALDLAKNLTYEHPELWGKAIFHSK